MCGYIIQTICIDILYGLLYGLSHGPYGLWFLRQTFSWRVLISLNSNVSTQRCAGVYSRHFTFNINCILKNLLNSTVQSSTKCTVFLVLNFGSYRMVHTCEFYQLSACKHRDYREQVTLKYILIRVDHKWVMEYHNLTAMKITRNFPK